MLDRGNSRKFSFYTGLIVRYEAGGRTAQTWLYRPGTFPLGLIGPADILWESDVRSGYQRRLWIRVHPSIFEEVWKPLREEISTSSQPNEPLAALISMRDLRGDLGSFEITGPLAGTVLKRVLSLSKAESPEKRAVSWPSVDGELTAVLPQSWQFAVHGRIARGSRCRFPGL